MNWGKAGAKLTALLMIALPSISVAQTSSTTSTTTSNAKTTLDPAPFASPRAEGMGGALSTIADDKDALYYNPAGIGGQIFGGKPQKSPFVRRLFFPNVAGSMNQNAQKLNSEFTAKGAQNSAQTGAAILDTHTGDRQYARGSISPIGLVLGRTAIIPVIDHQIAAVPQGDANSDVEFRYRSFTGAMIGASVADEKGRVSLGASTAVGTIQETKGTSPYTDMVDVDKRKTILKDDTQTYKASGINVGFSNRIPRAWSPTLTLVARDVGSTRNLNSNGGSPLVVQEDVTAGFGLSPQMSWGSFNMVVESGYLTDKQTSIKKKMRGGVEFLIGSPGSRALLGLRAGGTEAGASFGAHINLGLIGVEASSRAVDIGTNNERVIERRYSGSLFVDVASF